ncbi:MAG: glycosyltransferase family 2 protein [Lachnospiraceae bacterium]|nr:glycosyltransferase family 2 protein [Lachnospiraceae bacterium]
MFETDTVKVIVFTMAYNAQATIRRTIESILNQTFENFQYYILDNASADDTEDIIGEYAEKDQRIVPLHVNKNDPPNGGAFFHAIVHATDAKYIVWCDADDAYTSDFLENMVGFAEENQLDMAACGYDKVDGLTGKIIKHRVLDKNLILHDQLFADEFIQYRGFISYLWGKLYSIPFLKERHITGTIKKERICNDSIGTLWMFRNAKRAGIYGKAMYRYYQYPGSLSHKNIELSLHSYRDLWTATKEYLEDCGPVSKLNEDFLHAIHLSLVDEAAGNVFIAELNTEKKLELLEEIFSDPVWQETLKRDADPMFRNLAGRKEFISEIKEKVLSLPEIEQYSLERHGLFAHLDASR